MRKPGGAEIPVEMGNFANLKIGGRFSLIYVVFNTFFGILTQEDQVRCFTRVAKRLTSDGAFVIEAFVPDLTRYDQRASAPDHALISDERTSDGGQPARRGGAARSLATYRDR